MLTDRHVDAYIEDNIRCHANGSIDYGFYDQRAREGRGIAFRSACRSVTALVRRLTALFAGSRTERQPLTKRIQAPSRRCSWWTTAAKLAPLREAPIPRQLRWSFSGCG
jgi:hypothetical protein